MMERQLPDVRAFFAAAKAADMATLKRMLASDDSLIRARDESDGATALHLAKNAAVAELLLSYGADIDARDDSHGSPPLHWALDRQVFPDVSEKAPNRDLVPYLLDQGAKTEFRWFVAVGDLQRVKAMVEADATLVNESSRFAEASRDFHALWPIFRVQELREREVAYLFRPAERRAPRAAAASDNSRTLRRRP